MKTSFPSKVKDHFLSKENFTLQQVSPYGILKTIPQPDPEKIGAYYESEAYLSHDDSGTGFFATLYRTAKKINLRRKTSLIKAHHPSYKNILDIGCGTGDFLKAIPPAIHKTGVEVNTKAANIARKKGVTIYDSLDHIKDNYDVITLWHVLEHLYDPDKVFNFLQNHLTDQGVLIIALPNYKSWDAQHYKSYWAGYDVPRHLWHFDRSSIQKMAQAYNFNVVKILPMYMDSYYVSLLSEKYKKTSLGMFRALIKGSISNFKSLFTSECSSQIYILRKNEF